MSTHTICSNCFRYPGVFLYEHSNQDRTLEELARLPNAVPPPNPFDNEFPSEGIKFSDAVALFCE